MRVLVQRVSRATVSVDGEVRSSIGLGYLLLVGVGRGDEATQVDRLADKVVGLRIFRDADGKTNLSIADVDGEALVVSQFTLYADPRKGRRPSFVNAADPTGRQRRSRSGGAGAPVLRDRRPSAGRGRRDGSGRRADEDVPRRRRRRR